MFRCPEQRTENSQRDVEIELEDVEYMKWLVMELRSMMVDVNVIQTVVVEDGGG